MENKEKVFADGFIFKRPKEGAPDFVKGTLSIKADEATEFIKKYRKKDGWLNLTLKKSREGKLYLDLDQWEPKKREDAEINPDEIPF